MTARHTPLTAALRELRVRTGLSLAALAERTAYSKSSWERYLNGKSLPPRQAVQDLCRVANEPEGRLLALWEIAESDWSGRAATPTPATAEPQAQEQEQAQEQARLQPQPQPQPHNPPRPAGTGRPPGRGGRLLMVLASVYAVLVGGVVLVLLLLPGRDTPGDEPLPASAPYSLVPQCHGAACEGRDPMRMICGIDPDTLTTYRTATGAHVELRYSAKCGASWARSWGARPGDRVEVTVGGPTREVRVKDQADTEAYVYTAMTVAHPGSTVRACFLPGPAVGERECFEARVGETAALTRPPSPQ